MNDRLNFILTVIKRDYNTNDRLKFILSFIRRDNGLNDRLKLIKNGRRGYWYEEESKQRRNGPLRVYRMNWKLWNRKLTSWSSENDDERTKNGEECPRNWWWKCLRSVTEASWLGFFFPSFFFSSLILSDSWAPRVLASFPQPLRPFYSQKWGEACRSARLGELIAF